MKTKYFISSFALLGLISSTQAAETMSSSVSPNWMKDVDFNLENTFTSRYMADGVASGDEPTLQPAAGMTYKMFSTGLWSNFNTNETGTASDGEFTEVDWNADLTYSFEDLGISTHAGYVHYFFPNSTDSSTAEVTFGAEFAFAEYFNLHADGRVDVKENKGAWIGIFGPGVEYAFSDKVSMDAAMDLAVSAKKFNNALLSVNKMGLLSLNTTTGINWQATPVLSFRPYVAYASIINSDLRDGAKLAGIDRDVFSGGMTVAAAF